MDQDIMLVIIDENGTTDFVFRNLKQNDNLDLKRIKNENFESINMYLQQLSNSNDEFLKQGKNGWRETSFQIFY